MKRKKSIISFLVLFVMALTFIFTDSQTAQAAQATSITSGDEYVIVSNGYALTVNSNGDLSGTAYTDGETTVTDAMKWTVTQSGNGYTIYNESTGRYLRYKNSVTTSTSSNTVWRFDSNDGIYYQQFRSSRSYYLRYQNSWGGSQNGSNTLYTVNTEPAVYYPFSVNLFNYDTDLINAANSNGIQFNTGEGTEGTLNKWTGWGKGPFTGILSDTLDENGNIQFNNNYDTVGILDAGTVVNGKSTYTNVQLPFKYADGYYTFDSDDYDVYFEGGNAQSGATLVVNENQKNMVYDHSVTVWNGSRTEVSGGTGFFPFDGDGDTTPTYHFGMTFSTEFFMTENGYIDGDTSQAPISFEFSGDDDVWVFVDGRLVLDLGGIHDKVSGSINFAEGTSQVYYQNVTNGETITEDAQNLWQLLGTTADEWRSSTTPHTLQVFYLERGKGASNCKISFNLPQKNCVEVAKIMGNETSDQSELDVLNNQNFTFQAYSREEGADQWTPFANKVYYMYESNGQYVSAYRTGSSGEFSLKFGQTARFYMDQDIYTGSDADFYVTEVNAQNSQKSWTASVNGIQQGTSDTDDSPKLTISQMEDNASQTSALTTYTFNCTNTVGAQANDDLVVLDYGKPVQIDVLANDTLFGNDRSVGGIKKTDESSYTTDDDIDLENGTASVEDDKIVYTPTKFLDSIDHLDYVVGDEATEDGTNTAIVSVIPATNVYYEDNFAVSNGGTAVIEYSGTTETVTDGNKADDYQSDENRVYGQDAAYASQNGFSDGSATAMDQGATATFTFNGTGVDIYTKTDTKSPIVAAWIYRQTTDESGATSWKTVQSVIVDNKYDVEGDGLYQIPTICFDVEEYGTYKVKIQVMSATTETAKYYLDAIRIYNPVDPSSEDAEEAESAYQLAGEAGPMVTEVRDILLKAEDLTDNGRANGIVYLDNMTEGTTNIANYEKDGPKNEVYLDSGNAIAFTIEGYDDTQQVYLGVKAPEGSASQITVTNGTTTRTIDITSATDMYFAITPTSNGHVVILNSGDNLISITKIRTTNMQGDTTEAQALNFVVDENTLAYTQEFSVMALNAYDDIVTEEPAETEETVDIDVDISNPEPDNNPDIAQVNSVAGLIQSIISGLKSLFSNWR